MALIPRRTSASELVNTMQEHSNQDIYQPNPISSLFHWDPDIPRLEREVQDAVAAGILDDLTLVEIECSIDLIDAELLAQRGQEQDEPTKAGIEKLLQQRNSLAALQTRLHAIPQKRRRVA